MNAKHAMVDILEQVSIMWRTKQAKEFDVWHWNKWCKTRSTLNTFELKYCVAPNTIIGPIFFRDTISIYCTHMGSEWDIDKINGNHEFECRIVHWHQCSIQTFASYSIHLYIFHFHIHILSSSYIEKNGWKVYELATKRMAHTHKTIK